MKTRIIPLPSVDWGGGDVRDVALLEMTSPEGITGLGSAYAGVSQVRDALALYQQDPAWSGDLDRAPKTTKVLEELDYRWIEEPLAPDALEDFVRLTQLANVAIAGGEDFIRVKDFENLSNLKAVNILQPDCTRVGGLTRMQSIREAASQNDLHLIPHGWNTAVGLGVDLNDVFRI